MLVCLLALCTESQDSLVPSVQHLEKLKSCICHGITNWSSTENGVLLWMLQWSIFALDMLVCMLALCPESQDSLVPWVQHLENKKSCIWHGITNSSSTEIWVLLCALQRCTLTVDMLVCMLALCTESQDSLVGTLGTTSWNVNVMHMPWIHKLVKYRKWGVAMHAPTVYICTRHVGLYVGIKYRVAR
jgi:hypothetical protein